MGFGLVDLFEQGGPPTVGGRDCCLGSNKVGVRLLRLAALAGDGKAAYQVGVISLAGTPSKAPDPAEAARWWGMAAKAGHPLAAIKLEELATRSNQG